MTKHSLREKCPTGPYSVRIWENTDQKLLRIWTLFPQWLLSLKILLKIFAPRFYLRFYRNLSIKIIINIIFIIYSFKYNLKLTLNFANHQYYMNMTMKTVSLFRFHSFVCFMLLFYKYYSYYCLVKIREVEWQSN